MTKCLLCGDDHELIDSFFASGNNGYEFLSSTANQADVRLHNDMFIPDLFVFCIKESSEKWLNKVVGAVLLVQENSVPCTVVAPDEVLSLLFPRFAPESIKDFIPVELGFSGIFERISAVAATLEEKKEPPPPPVFNIEPPPPVDPKDAPYADKRLEAIWPKTTVVEQKRILVVDDDVAMLRTLKMFLERDYKVSVAPNGQVALNFLSSKPVDLVLLDYMMPQMNGSQVLTAIRNSPKIQNIPVVFLTGVSDRDKIKRLLGMGVQGYLLKPVDGTKLSEMVERILGPTE